MDEMLTVGKRPIALRVRATIDKCVPIIESLQPRFAEFADVASLVGLALQGLARYHWWFTSEEHKRLIHVMRLEDDYSRNATLIGRLVRRYSASPDLALRQKKFLNRMYHVLGWCLRDALELYEESEKELIREGVKIYMSESEGYGEHERLNASLWDFQQRFHWRQLDSSRGSNKAIIYPPTGFDTGGSSFQARNFVVNNQSSGVLSVEEQATLKQLLNTLSQPDTPRDLLKGDENGPDDSSGYRYIPPPVPPPKAPRKAPQNEVPGILKRGMREKVIKTVHWPDYKKSEVPSPSASESSPSPGDQEENNTRPIVPPAVSASTPVTDPRDQNGRQPPYQFVTTDSEASSSSPDGENPASKPPRPQLDGASPTSSESSKDKKAPDTAKQGLETPSDEVHWDPPAQPPSSILSSGFSDIPWLSSDTDDDYDDADDDSEDEPPQWHSKHGYRSPQHVGESSKYTHRADQAAAASEPDAVREQVARHIRAYLGPSHNEYSTALAALPAELSDGPGAGGVVARQRERERDTEDQLSPLAPSLGPALRGRALAAAADVKATALRHWSGVAGARRQERRDGHARLRALLRFAEEEGRGPLSPSSIRASTGLRRGLFEELDEPPEPPPKRRRTDDGVVRTSPAVDGDASREQALADLEGVQPRLDLSWAAFLFNQDALRLFGGLVGEHPQPGDLERMDKLLRELEVYIAVCKHRRGLVVGHLRETCEFPTAVGAQLGDLTAALRDAEEAQLSAARRGFDFVAARSKRVMTYPAGKLVRRKFGGALGPEDREKLEYLGEVGEEGAGALLVGLEAAEDWLDWAQQAVADWMRGWRPARVETAMLYVGEDVEADVRRYKWEINQKRHAIGLEPISDGPLDGVYSRQQGHIERLDALWRLTSTSPVDNQADEDGSD
ncbi:hypothetical protein KVR01_003191 [Diaporthe batatas]|uniref:uncharacterized protein n=1 Tax=Diaporthe batatas TaxID=748121 RepID=UPI001D03C46A|nr:uncharacterized protein KVR01_003191 [Diaporthe batatas]KAG8167502.1 hypothetical protein KVR01_003191 [Diaporthe batatas]